MAQAQPVRPNDDPRNIRAFGATSFLNDTASEMAYWILPAFLATIGAGPAKLGVIEGIAESVASFAKFFSGYLADRIPRRKPVVVSGYVVANSIKPVLALATSWWHVLLIRFADRFSKGIRGTARDVMVAESIRQERLGSAYGLIQAMDSAGAIVGPLAALLLLPRFGYRGVFWAAAVPGLLCILIASFGIHETGRSRAFDSGSQSERAQSALPLLPVSSPAHFSLPFYYVLCAVTLFSLGNSSDMFLVLRAQTIGIAANKAPLLGLVFNITYTLVSWPAGYFSDRFSRRGIAAAGYLVFALVYFVFGFAPSKLAIWITMAFYGLFYALTNPVLKALIVDTVHESERGRALGVYFCVTSVATLLASILAGELWKHFGAGVPFYFSAAIALLSTFLLLASRRQPRTSK